MARSPHPDSLEIRLEGDDSFRFLFDGSPVAMAILDRTGRFRRVNDRFRDVAGFPGDELVGHSFLEVTHPDDRRRCLRSIRRSRRGNRDHFRLERRFLRRDGRKFWGAVTVSAHRGTAERPDFYVVRLDDITARKQREVRQEGRNRVLEVVAGGAPLPETLETLATVAERVMPGVRCAILLADESGKCLRHVASPSLPAWYREAVDGFPIDKEAGCCGAACARRERIITSDLPDDPAWVARRAELVDAGIRLCWSEPIPSTAGGALGVIALYFRENRTPRTVDLEFIAAATYLARVAIERSRTLDALAASEEQYRKIFMSTTDGLLLLSQEATVVEVNPALCEMHDRTHAEFLRLTPPEFVHADSMNLFEEFRASLISGAEYRCEAKDLRRDGTPFDIEVHGVPFQFRGEPHLLAILRDVTEWKRTQRELAARARELESRNQDLEDFASVASHDLQEPLRKIRAFGDMLREELGADLGNRAAMYLKRILDSADWARILVRDLRHFSRTASARAAREPVALAEVVAGALSDLEIRIRETRAHVDVGPMPTVTGDAVQLRQLFLNLVGNALKFHRSGEAPRVRISAQSIDAGPDEDPWVRIRVEDDGIGFSPEYTEKIFGVFERLHPRDEYEGTGMGLAIVRKIVAQHEGRVRATSESGCGALFEVELPGG